MDTIILPCIFCTTVKWVHHYNVSFYCKILQYFALFTGVLHSVHVLYWSAVHSALQWVYQWTRQPQSLLKVTTTAYPALIVTVIFIAYLLCNTRSLGSLRAEAQKRLWDNEDGRRWGHDVEDTTLRTDDFEDRRRWWQATLRTKLFWKYPNWQNCQKY